MHMVRIRFGAFSLDRVNKLLKANWIDKLSYFGGTAGLFTGGSFISAFEFLPFVITLLIMFCQFLTKKKEKLRTVQVQEFKAKENENEDIDQKLIDISQKWLLLRGSLMCTEKKLLKTIRH